MVISVNSFAQSNDLTESQVFYRCYSQITGMRPTKGNQALLSQVEAGSISAADACAQVLAKANLTANGMTEVANNTDTEAINVLHEMHTFHSSWFHSRRFNASTDSCQDQARGDIYDASEPALFLTRSLFRTDLKFSDIATGTQSLQSVRTNLSPAVGAASGKATTFPYTLADNTTIATWMPNFVPTGTMYGIRNPPALPAPVLTTFSSYSGTTRQDLGIDVRGGFGGGLLGSQTYMMQNIAQEPDFRTPQNFAADGSGVMPRRWAKYIYTDLLCRDLPVIRIGDASPFVTTATTAAPFRKAVSCAQCHASMDRMSAGIRNARYGSLGNNCDPYQTPRQGGFMVMYKDVQSKPQETVWPTAPDPDYTKRPPQGTLYYRSYDGSLIYETFMGPEGLGQALMSHNDIYVCAAKRYFEYFTGISANLQDIQDPLNPITLNAAEQGYRDFVIQLGLSLKSHQSLQKLTKDIWNSPYYHKKNYGVGGGQ